MQPLLDARLRLGQNTLNIGGLHGLAQDQPLAAAERASQLHVIAVHHQDKDADVTSNPLGKLDPVQSRQAHGAQYDVKTKPLNQVNAFLSRAYGDDTIIALAQFRNQTALQGGIRFYHQGGQLPGARRSFRARRPRVAGQRQFHFEAVQPARRLQQPQLPAVRLDNAARDSNAQLASSISVLNGRVRKALGSGIGDLNQYPFSNGTGFDGDGLLRRIEHRLFRMHQKV